MFSESYSVVEREISLKGFPIRYYTKPGLPDWPSIEPSAKLITEAIFNRNMNLCLILGHGSGPISVSLARWNLSARFLILSHHKVDSYCTRLTLEANHVQNCIISQEISLLPDYEQKIDTALMILPKGRRLARRWLVEVYFLLQIGGQCYLSGPNDLGIQSIIQDGEALFGNSAVLAYRKGHRLARFIKLSEQPVPTPWLSEPGIYPGSWNQFQIPIDEHNFIIYSLPGIFSEDSLDEGSSLLIECLDVNGHTRIVDVGCGYGILGMVAAKRAQKLGLGAHVDLVDADLLAVAAAKKNVQANQISNATVLASDLLDAVQNYKYDLIISNPPFHAGKKVNYAVSTALILQSFHALLPGGHIILVANRFIRYEKIINEVFGNFRIKFQNSRFHVITAEKLSANIF